jgi:hypothetical protein
MITAERLAKRMIAELAGMIERGRVPQTIASVTELHAIIDASCLGGADSLMDECDDEASILACLDLNCAALDIVDEWIKARLVTPTPATP